MGVNYSEVIGRMKDAARLKNDSAVARDLGVTPQALSNYKKRGEMPSDLIIRFGQAHGLSIDWLVAGGVRPETEPAAAPYLGELSPDELVYTGKLLKVLRDGERPALATAVRINLDSCANEVRA